ncbi:hypothetical protein Acr_00g0042980 [Actinidia rufa]|uniref:Uncharacterized protein n=1 Tax=Actinidia rufa TaxID=165716 RepID=A0A7J0DIW5_9ERIC|nr:hypothetical protein Acr_00g0042980 [Actinidia rufa]
MASRSNNESRGNPEAQVEYPLMPRTPGEIRIKLLADAQRTAVGLSRQRLGEESSKDGQAKGSPRGARRARKLYRITTKRKVRQSWGESDLRAKLVVKAAVAAGSILPMRLEARPRGSIISFLQLFDSFVARFAINTQALRALEDVKLAEQVEGTSSREEVFSNGAKDKKSVVALLADGATTTGNKRRWCGCCCWLAVDAAGDGGCLMG